MNSRKRNHQSGQAMIEMVAGLILLMCVFTGVLLVSALGLENVETMIDLRNTMSSNVATGLASAGTEAVTLSNWNTGNDGILFTADDAAIEGEAASVNTFNAEMITQSDSSTSLDIQSSFAKNYVLINDFDDLPASELFTTLAGLQRYHVVQSDPLHERGLDDLGNAIQALFHTDSSFSVSDTIFYPVVNP